MKKIIAVLLLSIVVGTDTFAQNTEAKAKTVATNIRAEKHLSSSILLWMRTDKARQAGMDRWKGPHSKIISANKGLWEYRQIHFVENNSGLWQPISGVETTIPTNRKIDGVADVTLKNLFSVFRGKKQNKLAYADEVNLFKRTILYAAFPKNSKWYSVAQPSEKIEARSMVFFKKKDGISDKDFKNFINDELTPALANTGMLKELRNKAYNPWKQEQWNTPNVAHDNAPEVQFQASLILGFSNDAAMKSFFSSEELKKLSNRLSVFCSTIHAYEIAETLTFVKNGTQLAQYQK
ncbi:strictosidine synthase [Runella aurantiaca]|uniref:Strictosidine synthase n=1 Tax=Runella aurantiaca TaxID=2282308 RepID=A0A369I524_9BACT|nr:strictosidine synthase [Runella aurantiaca]RDB02623.1 strictosidine synthase [Runella aurantiaca]